jgi:hypothetical protein
MTASTATATEVIYHEVVWGDDEADRQTYADYGDDSFLSATAEQRATSAYLHLIRNGVACGFWTNGALVAGRNVTGGPDRRPAFLDDPQMYAEWAAGNLNDDGTPKAGPIVEHKTRTVLSAYQTERYKTKSNGSCGRHVRSENSVALCSCGWTQHTDSRAEARSAARAHRRDVGSESPVETSR